MTIHCQHIYGLVCIYMHVCTLAITFFHLSTFFKLNQVSPSAPTYMHAFHKLGFSCLSLQKEIGISKPYSVYIQLYLAPKLTRS